MQAKHLCLLPLTALLLVGCGGPAVRDSGPARRVDVSHVPDAVPRSEPLSRYGNPASYVVNGKRYHVMSDRAGYVERGIASWYGTKFHGRRTSSGEPYDMYGMTAAHRTLPLPTYVRVTNLANNRSVVVKVNDRGPFHSERIIDLSYAAASKLGVLGRGTAHVEVRAIEPDAPATLSAETPVTTRPAALATKATEAQPIAMSPAEPAPTAPGPVKRLFLQVGAFAERGNAEQLRARLQGTDLGPVFVHASEDAIFRVRLGPFQSPEEAERLTSRLGVLGLTASRVFVD